MVFFSSAAHFPKLNSLKFSLNFHLSLRIQWFCFCTSSAVQSKPGINKFGVLIKLNEGTLLPETFSCFLSQTNYIHTPWIILEVATELSFSRNEERKVVLTWQRQSLSHTVRELRSAVRLWSLDFMFFWRWNLLRVLPKHAYFPSPLLFALTLLMLSSDALSLSGF